MSDQMVHRIWDKSTQTMIRSKGKNSEKNLIPIWMDKEDLRYIGMDYTGKKDIEGKYIFEGDIVECKFRGKGIVMFKGSCFLLVTLGNWQYVGRLVEPKIIGNMYENPELIPDEMKNKNSLIDFL